MGTRRKEVGAAPSKGDGEFFAPLLAAQGSLDGFALALCKRLGVPLDYAADAVQEALARVLVGRRRPGAGAGPHIDVSYVAGIVRNVIRRERRSQLRAATHAPDTYLRSLPDASQAEPATPPVGPRRLLDGWLRAGVLSPRQEVLLRARRDGTSVRALSRRIGMKPKDLRDALRRATERLRILARFALRIPPGLRGFFGNKRDAWLTAWALMRVGVPPDEAARRIGPTQVAGRKLIQRLTRAMRLWKPLVAQMARRRTARPPPLR